MGLIVKFAANCKDQCPSWKCSFSLESTYMMECNESEIKILNLYLNENVFFFQFVP